MAYVRSRAILAVAGALSLASPLGASAQHVHPKADAQALDLAEKAIALRSVAGPGNKTPEVAEVYKSALVQGGFDPADITIFPIDDTAYLIARWPGSDPSLKPVVISGHMDVVEAKRADWQRDPFTPVVENGYLFGRGATDMKLDGTIAIASLIELKREGYKPRRTIIIEFSGDEETTMKTSAIIADKLANAEMVLNIDGGGGVLNDHTGAPEYFTWQGAEKTYADYQLTVTNPGGHSSEPRAVNAIDELAAALLRIQTHHFKPELNALTHDYFVQAARYQDPRIGAAMRAFAADPTDAQAIATLRADPAHVGEIGTTCVVTMINGGHALNALPQSAHRQHQLPHLPRPPAAGDHGGAEGGGRRSGDHLPGRHRRFGGDRRIARAGRLRRRGEGGDGDGPAGRAGVPEPVVGRQRQHVVPLSRRAELRRERCLHQAVGGLQPRPERANPGGVHRARDRLRPVVVPGPF